MRTIITIIAVALFNYSSAQNPTVRPAQTNKPSNFPERNSVRHWSPTKTTSQPTRMPGNAVRRNQSITERRLGTGSDTVNSKPFVNGIYANNNPNAPLDTMGTAIGSGARTGVYGTIIPGANDTTFNVNTINSNGLTISGAEDRSGQTQFGQTNWARNNRNTVGVSQWTVPPPISTSFNKSFPNISNATWSRNNIDTTQFIARYNTGAVWVTTTFSSAGHILETRTEIPVVYAPRAVEAYRAKQPTSYQILSIYKLQIQGLPEVYEVRSSDGRLVYLNNEGMEVRL